MALLTRPGGRPWKLDRRRLAVLSVSLAVAVLFLLPGPDRWSGHLDALCLSFLMRQQPPPADVVGVTMDEASLDALGRYPWKRSVHARLIDRLTALGASCIALDTFFVRPTEPAEDAALAAAIRRSGRVVLSLGNHRGRTRATPLFAEEADHRVGHTFVRREEGGMVYRIQLLASVAPSEGAPELPVPAFALLAAQFHRHREGIPTFDDHAMRVGDLTVPLETGRHMLVRFAGPPGTLRTVSYVDVLRGKVAREQVAGKIAVVYATFDPNDQFETPADRQHPMPGGEIHANAIGTLLSGSFIRRPGGLIEAALLLAVAFLVAAALGSVHPGQYVPRLAAVVAVVGVGAFLAFRTCFVWIPLARIALFVPIAAVAIMGIERVRARRLLAAFVPLAEADRLLDSDGHLTTASRKVVVSVLFADIRGYTTLSETLEPQRMTEFLNEFHAVTHEAVRAHGGEVFDYLGDASMVVFGAPREDPEHARHAVDAALDMQQRLQEKRPTWVARGYPEVEVGIGVCTGEVAYGLMGTGHRQFTAIGDTTNVAARIQGLSSQFDCSVLISDSTFAAAGAWFETRALPLVPLKGKTEPVQIHAVAGRRGGR